MSITEEVTQVYSISYFSVETYNFLLSFSFPRTISHFAEIIQGRKNPLLFSPRKLVAQMFVLTKMILTEKSVLQRDNKEVIPMKNIMGTVWRNKL